MDRKFLIPRCQKMNITNIFVKARELVNSLVFTKMLVIFIFRLNWLLCWINHVNHLHFCCTIRDLYYYLQVVSVCLLLCVFEHFQCSVYPFVALYVRTSIKSLDMTPGFLNSVCQADVCSNPNFSKERVPHVTKSASFFSFEC